MTRNLRLNTQARAQSRLNFIFHEPVVNGVDIFADPNDILVDRVKEGDATAFTCTCLRVAVEEARYLWW